MEPDIRVRPESDPVVLELKQAGGEDQGELVLLVWGAAGKTQDLRLQAELGVLPADAGEFRFTVGEVVWEELSDDPDEPVRGRIPITCQGGTEGREARTSLTVTLSLGDEVIWQGDVGLIAAVDHVLPSWEALLEEYETLQPSWKKELREAVEQAGPAGGDKLKALYGVVHRHGREGDGLAAICLSGGGIRSATFNLGVLQGLAKIGLLQRFHYLSSVSGGGYIASWLGGWIHRAGGLDRIEGQLQGGQPDPARPEVEELSHLRQYSNYLTPRLGFLSADTWTLAAIVVRNLMLNLLVIVPLPAAVLAVPLLALSRPPRWWDLGPDTLYWIGAVLAGTALFSMSLLRASARAPRRSGDQRPKPPSFLLRGLVPLLASTPFVLLAIARYGERNPDHYLHTREVIVRCLIWSILVPMVAFLLSVPSQKRIMGRQRSSLKADLFALLLSGGVEALIYVGVLKGWIPWLLDRPRLYVILGPGLILGPMLLGKTLFVAFSSVVEGTRYSSELGDADREWWARWSGWTLLVGLLWIGASALVLYAPFLLHTAIAKVSAAIAAGGLGGLTSFLGKSGKTSAKQEGQEKAASPWRGVVMAFAAPLFCLALLLLISAGTQEILRALFSDGPSTAVQPFRGEALALLGVIVGLLAAGMAMGMFVNVNRFSLQAMYRNRLVRAYLGASNRHRRPNLFTGFDPADNLRLHWLHDNRPLPVVNMALNLVGGEDLAWQQRKAESFTATPLHCGSGCLGFRRSQIYGGEQGISVGTAVATSGAAANPNMGYNSSPSITFIMALFNARLGIWLGNPGPPGERTYTRSAPGNSARLAFAEAFGWTDDRHPYVNLSDGGHFDNLGLYEMVRRRCRFIVVGDAGRDPACAFDDLGNAIRKIRIDFGISVEFEKTIRIFPKRVGEPDSAARYCALGRIRYDAVDGEGNFGTLIYIKPAICGAESYDIYNYARSSQDFPHETTADQWFDETQFESYRALGRQTLLTIAGSEREMTLERFAVRVGEYILKGRETGIVVEPAAAPAVEPAIPPELLPQPGDGGEPALPA